MCLHQFFRPLRLPRRGMVVSRSTTSLPIGAVLERAKRRRGPDSGALALPLANHASCADYLMAVQRRRLHSAFQAFRHSLFHVWNPRPGHHH